MYKGKYSKLTLWDFRTFLYLRRLLVLLDYKIWALLEIIPFLEIFYSQIRNQDSIHHEGSSGRVQA